MFDIRSKISRGLLLLLLLLWSRLASAGGYLRIPDVSRRPLHIDMYAGMSVGGYLMSATFPVQGLSDMDALTVAPGVGVGVHGNKGWGIQANLGYKYMQLGTTGESIPTHWCYYDVQANYLILTAGYLSDILVSRVPLTAIPTKYSGFCHECLHSMTHVLYAGVRVPIRDANLVGEIRVGGYLQSPIHAENMSRYMMNPVSESRLYLEVKLSYRLFTTGRNKSMY